MKSSLRKVLADSHVSAVAIAVLLLFSMDSLFRALLDPLLRAASFVFTAIAILGLPYFSHTFTSADRRMLSVTLAYFIYGFVSLAAAWLLGRWVHGVGPFRCLSKYRNALARRNHV